MIWESKSKKDCQELLKSFQVRSSTDKQRKQKHIRINPTANQTENIKNSQEKLKLTLLVNMISNTYFATTTMHHFNRQTKKKKLIFEDESVVGPPSTGKPMIMESWVNMHYNFERLTGLTPGSSFNFASLLHTNACFMDECKLTDNQFEQWKSLAAGQCVPT